MTLPKTSIGILGASLMATAAEQLNGRLTTDFSPEGALLRVCFRD